MPYGIIVKNRFTGKIYEEHDEVNVNTIYKVQDKYMFRPWVKFIVWKYGEEIE